MSPCLFLVHPLKPALVNEPDVGLTDYIVKNKIFNFFLYEGCVPLTSHHHLMSKIMTDPGTPWKKPVEVYGYNDAVHFFGSIFEAETNCIAAHNMGQVASSGVNNFSFFNRWVGKIWRQITMPFWGNMSKMKRTFKFLRAFVSGKNLWSRVSLMIICQPLYWLPEPTLQLAG